MDSNFLTVTKMPRTQTKVSLGNWHPHRLSVLQSLHPAANLDAFSTTAAREPSPIVTAPGVLHSYSAGRRGRVEGIVAGTQHVCLTRKSQQLEEETKFWCTYVDMPLQFVTA
jgi:hypothetical protein